MHALESFEDFLKNHHKEFDAHAIATLYGIEKKPLWEAVPARSRRPVVLIGPEGDFTPQEAADAIAAGYQAITLGPYTFKVATACAYIASLLLCELSLIQTKNTDGASA